MDKKEAQKEIFKWVLGIMGVIIGAIIAQNAYTWFNQQPPVISDLISTPPGPQVEGTTITWNAIASDPNKDAIHYKFELSGPSTGNRYVVKQDWSGKNDWIWNSTNFDIGMNYIRVSVKDEKHNEPTGNSTKLGACSIVDTQGEIGYSNIKTMILDETYTFSAYVARNDSIQAARRMITTGRDIGERPVVSALNNTLIDPDFHTGSQVFVSNITIKHPVIQVDLKGNAFEISRQSPDNLTIPVGTDKNYGMWLWNVKPTKKGTHFLELIPYEVPSKTPIGGGSVKIEVTVNSVPETTGAVAPDAGPAPVEEPAAEKPAAEEQPGFESTFAITGLLAVAYLVLGRRG